MFPFSRSKSIQVHGNRTSFWHKNLRCKEQLLPVSLWIDAVKILFSCCKHWANISKNTGLECLMKNRSGQITIKCVCMYSSVHLYTTFDISNQEQHYTSSGGVMNTWFIIPCLIFFSVWEQICRSKQIGIQPWLLSSCTLKHWLQHCLKETIQEQLLKEGTKTYLKEIAILDFVLNTFKLRQIATHHCKPGKDVR